MRNQAKIEDSDLTAPEDGAYDVILAIHSLYTVDLGHMSKLVLSLRPGGVMCIWHGTLENNVLNSLANTMDEFSGRGRCRNYAEEVDKFLSRAILRRDAAYSCTAFTRKIPNNLVNPDKTLTEQGISAVQFAALSSYPPSLELQSAAINSALTRPEASCAEFTVTDYLMCFKRPK